MQLPRMFLMRQTFPDRAISDIQATLRERLVDFYDPRLKPGACIAVGVGSRGISNLPLIVKTTIRSLQDLGCEPFIFPCMGSHGGATAEGQKNVLADLGITEQAIGCKILSSMELVATGRTLEGIETFADKNAIESDGMFFINRINRHTDFVGEKIESGLQKMDAVGMGKREGARACHNIAYAGQFPNGQPATMEDAITGVFRHHLNMGKIIGGIAIVEDGNNNTAHLSVIAARDIEKVEPHLLKLAKKLKPSIPVSELDLLIVNEIGKNISGPGMDPFVINRSSTTGKLNPYKRAADDLNLPPWIGHIYARSLHPDSHGIGMGIGFADYLRNCVLKEMNEKDTLINAETAQILNVIKCPAHHYDTDLECFKAAATMTFQRDFTKDRVGWIPNTRNLNEIWFSENLLSEIQLLIKANAESQDKDRPKIEIIGFRTFEFDAFDQLPARPFSGALSDSHLTLI